jgi:tyrosine-protein kinase
MDNTPNYAGPPEDQRPASVGDFANMIRRWLWVIVLVPLVMAGTAVAFSFLQTPKYVATATLMVGQEQGQVGNPAKVDELQLLTQSAVGVITTSPVTDEVAERLGFAADGDAILASLEAEQVEGGQLIELTYTDTNAVRAQQIVNTVGAVAGERISALPISAHDINATVVEEAAVPTTPEEPDPLRNGVLAAALGAMLAFGLAFLMEIHSK